MYKKHPTQSLKVYFENSAGHTLAGLIDSPADTQPTAYAIMCHCFTCTKETLTTARVCRGLAQKGLAILRFDFTGLGDSEGAFSDSNFSTMVNDVLAANDFLAAQYQTPTVLIGHSMGGTAVLAASAELDNCHTVVCIASPAKPQHVLHHFGSAIQALNTGQASDITVAGKKYPIKPQFISDVTQYNLTSRLTAYSKRLLSICAGKDEMIEKKEVEDIIHYTTGAHKLLHLDEADHLFRNRDASNVMINEIYDWIMSA